MSKKTLLLILFSLTFSLTSFGQLFKKVVGNDKYEWREYRVADFHKINISDAFNIIYKINPDSAGLVKVYGEENILEMLTLKSEKGKLTMKLSSKIKPEFGIINIMVYSSNLIEVDNQGAATLDIVCQLDAPELKFTVLGAGQINVQDISCGVVKINVGGSGDVSIKGKAGYGDYNIQGSGDIKAEFLTATVVSASITGSGVIKCHAEKSLKTILTGSGNVKYNGNPELKMRTVGTGSVLPLK